MTDSRDVQKVRRIGAVRQARLESALADALQQEKSAQGAVKYAQSQRDSAIATANDARRDSTRDPACEASRLWLGICLERVVAALDALSEAERILAETQEHRASCAAALLRHKSRDDALAGHGAKLARGERRIAEIKGEDELSGAAKMGTHFIHGGIA